jgi:hypothetical protein
VVSNSNGSGVNNVLAALVVDPRVGIRENIGRVGLAGSVVESISDEVRNKRHARTRIQESVLKTVFLINYMQASVMGVLRSATHGGDGADHKDPQVLVYSYFLVCQLGLRFVHKATSVSHGN